MCLDASVALRVFIGVSASAFYVVLQLAEIVLQAQSVRERVGVQVPNSPSPRRLLEATSLSIQHERSNVNCSLTISNTSKRAVSVYAMVGIGESLVYSNLNTKEEYVLRFGPRPVHINYDAKWLESHTHNVPPGEHLILTDNVVVGQGRRHQFYRWLETSGNRNQSPHYRGITGEGITSLPPGEYAVIARLVLICQPKEPQKAADEVMVESATRIILK